MRRLCASLVVLWLHDPILPCGADKTTYWSDEIKATRTFGSRLVPVMGENRPVTTATKTPKADSALVAAVDSARRALEEEVAAGDIGEHLGTQPEAERVVTHLFAATLPGYIGWRWAVTLTRAPRQKAATVNEVVLLPGDGALTAPEWIPWKDRVGKGDLGPGDLVPVADDDLRLVAGYLNGDEVLDGTSAREVREVVRELGMGRERVLSVEGREDAAERWIAGDNGPDTPLAQAAPAHCGTCGFLVRLAGPLATVFGVCANGSSPSDGHAVSFDHGCGAHSDVRIEASQHQPVSLTPVLDTISAEVWAEPDVEVVT